MDLRHVRKASGDKNAAAVAGPVAKRGRADVLVAVELVYERRWDGRHLLHEELAVIGLGANNLGRCRQGAQHCGRRTG